MADCLLGECRPCL